MERRGLSVSRTLWEMKKRRGGDGGGGGGGTFENRIEWDWLCSLQRATLKLTKYHYRRLQRSDGERGRCCCCRGFSSSSSSSLVLLLLLVLLLVLDAPAAKCVFQFNLALKQQGVFTYCSEQIQQISGAGLQWGWFEVGGLRCFLSDYTMITARCVQLCCVYAAVQGH